MPSYLAAHLHDCCRISRSRPVFLRRGLSAVDLGPELQCLLKVKEDLNQVLIFQHVTLNA